MTAFAPLGAMGYDRKPPHLEHLNPLEEDVIKELAKKYDKTPA